MNLDSYAADIFRWHVENDFGKLRETFSNMRIFTCIDSTRGELIVTITRVPYTYIKQIKMTIKVTSRLQIDTEIINHQDRTTVVDGGYIERHALLREMRRRLWCIHAQTIRTIRILEQVIPSTMRFELNDPQITVFDSTNVALCVIALSEFNHICDPDVNGRLQIIGLDTSTGFRTEATLKKLLTRVVIEKRKNGNPSTDDIDDSENPVSIIDDAGTNLHMVWQALARLTSLLDTYSI